MLLAAFLKGKITMNINFTAPCLLGVEGIVAQELKRLGAEMFLRKTAELISAVTIIFWQGQISAQDTVKES